MTVADGNIILAADLNATAQTISDTIHADGGAKGNENMTVRRWPVLFRWYDVTTTSYTAVAAQALFKPMCDHRLIGWYVRATTASSINYFVRAQITVSGGDTDTRYLRGRTLELETPEIDNTDTVYMTRSTTSIVDDTHATEKDEIVLFRGVTYIISVMNDTAAKTTTVIDVGLSLEAKVLREIIR